MDGKVRFGQRRRVFYEEFDDAFPTLVAHGSGAFYWSLEQRLEV